MTTYRVYLLDARGRITWGEWFEAASETEAQAYAKARCGPGTPTVELWRKTERLWRCNCPELEIRASA